SFASLTDTNAAIPLEIGRHYIFNWGSPEYYYSGKIDDISIYNRALSTQEVDTLFTTGITALNNDNSIKVFPNPAADQLTIEYDKLNRPSPQFILYNSFGEEVMNRTLTAKTNTIDISKLPAGIYFYKLCSEQSIINAGKIAKL